MVPSFGMEGGLALALTRGASVAAVLSVFGIAAFQYFVAPRAFALMPADIRALVGQRLHELGHFSIAAAMLATLAWLLMQTADIADAATVARAVAALPAVLSGTAFGHLIILQMVVLLAVAGVLGWRPHPNRTRLIVGCTGLATVLQAGHSHAMSMYGGPSLLLASDAIHLLGAGAWLGGLLPLLIVVRAAPPKAGATAARWFAPLGKICIAALVVSAAFQGWVLIASIPGLVGTAYGWISLLKLALLGVLLAFAAANRYRFAPALLRADPAAAKRLLVRSIAVQTGFGLAVVAAAAVLSNLPPAMHVQPLWPFAERFSLDTIQEAPGFQSEVVGAVLALCGAAALLMMAALLPQRVLRQRSVRWLAVAGAVVIAWFAVLHLDLLFVTAYPTSYYRSPTNFAATTIVRGSALFPQHCAACHSPTGKGPTLAADLTAAHLWMHSDGELFWWLSHGIEAPDGSLAMPGFADTLSEDDRWALIDYIRANNAGLTFRHAGDWSPHLQAPDLQADCAGERTMTLGDLRGGFVRLVIGTSPPSLGSLVGVSVTTILATTDPASRPANRLCIASDEALPRAYAIVSGRSLEELAGTQFLIDGSGWLRAIQPAGTVPGWDDPRVLSAEIRRLAAHPIHANTGGGRMDMQMQPD